MPVLSISLWRVMSSAVSSASADSRPMRSVDSRVEQTPKDSVRVSDAKSQQVIGKRRPVGVLRAATLHGH